MKSNKISKIYILLSENEKNDLPEYYNDDKVLKLLDKLNLYLKKEYNGKYKFNLCDSENGLTPDKLKLTPKKKRSIKSKWLEFNSELSKIQRNFESYLQKEKDSKK